MLIPLTSLVIPPNRQRRDFDPKLLAELGESISLHGLLQPLVVRRNPNDADLEETWLLVAGERRLRAIADIRDLGGVLRFGEECVPADSLPVVTLGQLEPLAAEEAEFEENIRRTDLTWDERASTTLRLSNLRTKQAELAGTKPPTAESLAKDIGRKTAKYSGGEEVTNVVKQLVVARHLADPEVKGAKNLDDAFKVLVQRESKRKNIELAETVGRTFTSAAHRLFNEEALSWMAAQPPEQFDLILTDPPYGMDAQDFGDAGGRLANEQDHKYDDSLAAWEVLMSGAASEFYRLAKPQAHAYICCDIDSFHRLKAFMLDAGWYVFRTPLINFKTDGNRTPLPQNGPRRQYETILYAIKGWRPVLKLASDVIQTTGDDNLGHGAQKPVALYSNLLSRSCRPGDSVLDPFCGTGTIFAACHAASCLAVGVERDQAYYAIALKRLQGLA